MIGWVGRFEWFVGQLLSVAEILLPVIATCVGVFLGVYINGIIDREREREIEFFRPLFSEVRAVQEVEPLQPISPLIDDGDYQSVLFTIRPLRFHALDQKTRETVMAYLEAVEQLATLADTTLSTSVLLHESGYGEFLEAELPDKLLLDSDEGIGSGEAAPGPQLVAGQQTIISGPNPVLPSNSTRVSGDDRKPLLPLLVAHGPVLATIDSAAELRAFFKSQTDVDVTYLDERCPEWAGALAAVLQQSWQGEPIDYEDESVGRKVVPEDQYPNMVEGDDFQDILASAGMALQARRISYRRRVIDRAAALHEQLLRRLSQPLYHPKRILLARRRSIV